MTLLGHRVFATNDPCFAAPCSFRVLACATKASPVLSLLEIYQGPQYVLQFCKQTFSQTAECGVQFFQSVRSADYLPNNICRLVRNRALLARWKHLHFTEGHCEKVPQCLGPQPDFEKFLRSQIILMDSCLLRKNILLCRVIPFLSFSRGLKLVKSLTFLEFASVTFTRHK